MPNQPPDLTSLDLDDAIRRHTSPRRRALQIGGMVALVVVVGIVAFDLIRAQQASVVVPPPPVLVSNVSFGTVTLNGQRLKGSPPLVLPLRDGTNHITLSAAPFAPRSCQLTWRANALANIGDCPAEGRDTRVVVGGRTIAPGLIVALTFSDADLPAESLASARNAIMDTLARVHLGPLTLAPGESIATGGFFPVQVNSTTGGFFPVQVNSTTTHESLQADVSFTLPNQVPGGPFPSTCDNSGNVICAGVPLATSNYPVSAEWAVTLVAAYHWTYSDASGTVMATSMDYPFIPPMGMLLAADGASGWTVAGAPSADASAAGSFGTWAEKLCGAGLNMLEANTQPHRGTASIVRDQGVGGCELLFTTLDGQTSRFIWRCGVLLADGAAASQLVPGVPVAPPFVIKMFGG